MPRARVRAQSARELVRPPRVGVHGRPEAVGDRITQGDDRVRARVGGHLDPRQKVPGRRGRRHRQFPGAGMVAAAGDVVGLIAAVVQRDRRGRSLGRAGEVEVDRQIGVCRDPQVGIVAEQHGARRNRRRALAGEQERSARCRLDRRVLHPQADMRAADRERRGAEDVAQRHADALASDAHVDDLPQGLIGDVNRDDGARHRRRCRRCSGGSGCGRCRWRGGGLGPRGLAARRRVPRGRCRRPRGHPRTPGGAALRARLLPRRRDCEGANRRRHGYRAARESGHLVIWSNRARCPSGSGIVAREPGARGWGLEA